MYCSSSSSQRLEGSTPLLSHAQCRFPYSEPEYQVPMGVFGFQVDKEEVKSTTSSFGARKARVSISTLKGSGLKPFGSMTSMVTSITPSTVFLSERIVYDEASPLVPGGMSGTSHGETQVSPSVAPLIDTSAYKFLPGPGPVFSIMKDSSARSIASKAPFPAND